MRRTDSQKILMNSEGTVSPLHGALWRDKVAVQRACSMTLSPTMRIDLPDWGLYTTARIANVCAHCRVKTTTFPTLLGELPICHAELGFIFATAICCLWQGCRGGAGCISGSLSFGT